MNNLYSEHCIIYYGNKIARVEKVFMKGINIYYWIRGTGNVLMEVNEKELFNAGEILKRAVRMEK